MLVFKSQSIKGVIIQLSSLKMWALFFNWPLQNKFHGVHIFSTVLWKTCSTWSNLFTGGPYASTLCLKNQFRGSKFFSKISSGGSIFGGSTFYVTELECAIYCWYYGAVEKKAERWLCVEQSRELFSKVRGRGGASNACFHSWISPSRRQAVNF